MLNEIEHSIAIEEAGFADLVEGSDIKLDELRGTAPDNWYLSADEALERGLVRAVI